MRQLDLLITHRLAVPRKTLSFLDTVGISDNEFIQYANDAQDELESIISKVNADAFLTSKVVTLSQGLRYLQHPIGCFVWDQGCASDVFAQRVEVELPSSESGASPVKW